MCLPCFGVVQRAVAHVALILGHAHSAMGARLGGARVVGQLAAGAVKESRTPAARLCGVNKAHPKELLIKATGSKIIRAKGQPQPDCVG